MRNSSLVRLAGGWVAYMAIRRFSRRSGVTDREFSARLPGDDVIPDPMVEWTRATTVNAPPEAVWPWLVQMGFGRGGWYTSERFDRLVWRIENKSADVILPEWQQLSAGDIVPDGPGYAAYFHVIDVEEEEAIVYRSIRHPYRGHPVDAADDEELLRLERTLKEGRTYLDFSWAWVLYPQGSTATRLLVRTRATIKPSWAKLIELPLGLVDLFHVATMFHGIKRRVGSS